MKVAFGRMKHGFCLKFDNGLKLSTMHFCDNYGLEMTDENEVVVFWEDAKAPLFKVASDCLPSRWMGAKAPLLSDNVEVAVFSDKKKFITGWQEAVFGNDSPQDDVRGYVNLPQWLQLVDWCKNWKEKGEL